MILSGYEFREPAPSFIQPQFIFREILPPRWIPWRIQDSKLTPVPSLPPIQNPRKNLALEAAIFEPSNCVDQLTLPSICAVESKDRMIFGPAGKLPLLP